VVDVGKLVSQVADGRRKAFEILLTIYESRFLAVARAITGDAAAAEDAVQEAFIRILRFAADADAHRNPDPWLFRICVNCARDERDRSRRSRPAEDSFDWLDGAVDLSTPLSLSIAAEDRSRLVEALAALKPELRVVLLLRFTADLKYDQIAGVLGIPAGTVKSRLHAALGMLRRTVGVL